MDATESPDLRNYRIQSQRYRVRPVLSRLNNTPLADPVVTLVYTLDQDSNELVVACTTQGIYKLSNDVFVQLTGPTLHGDTFTRFSTSGWNKKMVFSTGYDPVGIVDFDNGVYSFLPGAPTGPFVATFGGRIIVANSNRLTWCAKDNENDWTGLGSGYEDLLAAPGGVVDAVHGVFPITDTYALVVRSRSVWAMQITGNFDVPFIFTRIWANTESIAPWSLVLTPIGVVGLFSDGVYLLSLDSPPQPIGLRVRDIMVIPGIRQAVATYDIQQAAYCLAIPQADGVSTLVWRYYIREQRWTYDYYPFVITHLIAANYQSALQIAQLTGQINQLVGPIYLLGTSEQKSGLIMTDGVANHYCVRDDNWNSGVAADQYPDGTFGNTTAYLTSDILRGDSLLYSGQLIEVEVEYICNRTTTLRMEWSTDGGISWFQSGTITCTSSQYPKIGKFPGNLTRERLQIRLISEDAQGLQIISCHPRYAQEGKIAP
jgi:hypothetical protein